MIEEICLFGINNEYLYKEGLFVKERLARRRKFGRDVSVSVWARHVSLIIQEYRKINGHYNKIVPGKLPDIIRIACAEKLIELYYD